MNEKERNLRVAEALGTEFERNGQTFKTGDCVALLDGSIIAVAETRDDAISALRAIDPEPNLNGFCQHANVAVAFGKARSVKILAIRHGVLPTRLQNLSDLAHRQAFAVGQLAGELLF